MTSWRTLARNSALNLFGLAAPMVVAFFAIPLLIRGMGTERFGVLTIAWMAIGYFSLFDLGLSRALTKLVAERLGPDGSGEIGPVSWTALLLMLALGAVGGALLFVLGPWLVGHVLNIDTALHGESLRTFQLLAVSLPFVITTGGFRAVLEAYQRFDLVTWLRLPLGIATYAVPLAVLPFSHGLVAVVGALVIARVVAWALHLAVCLRAVAALRTRPALHAPLVRPLLAFGGWMTVSNLISPAMVYFDRFVIGALISMTAVAYYVTPYEVVTRLWIVPGAVMGVFFPAISSSFAHDRAHAALLFDRSLRALALAVFPFCLLIVLFAPEALALWLGADFAARSAPVAQWLAIGIFVNCAGQAAFAVVQGGGRPDLTGKLHMVELPIYALVLWLALRHFGIVGAAVAWTVRLALDALLLVILADRMLPRGSSALRSAGPLLAAGTAVLCAALLPGGAPAKLLVLAVGTVAYGIVAARMIASVRGVLPATPEPALTPNSTPAP
jgi:O-antigen/teichoic acid export membrane protein